MNHDIDARHGHLDDPHDDGGKDRGNDGERSGTDASSGSRAVVRDAGIGAAQVTPDRAEDGSLFCLAVSPPSRPATLVSCAMPE